MKIAKLYLLNLIRQNKHILFGKLTVITHEIKISKWKEMAEHAYDLGILDENKGWRYLRDTVWQNWRKRTIDKVDNGMKTNGGGGKICKWDKSDEIILEILGRNLPEVNIQPHTESSVYDEGYEATEETLEIEYNNTDNPPRKKIKIEELDKKVLTLEDMERKIVDTKLKILERDCYLKNLEIYRNENELGLRPSRFTKSLYNNRKRMAATYENILS